MDNNRTNHTGKLLADALIALGLKPNTAGFRKIAAELAKADGGNPGWSRSYMHQVHSGKLAGSKRLRRAIEIRMASLDGTSMVRAASREVTVMEMPGSNVAGALVYGRKRMCGKSDCFTRFVPNTNRRKYCYECSPPAGA